jgi:hypothetical protein
MRSSWHHDAPASMSADVDVWQLARRVRAGVHRVALARRQSLTLDVVTAGGYAILSILSAGLLGVTFYALTAITGRLDRLDGKVTDQFANQGERLVRLEVKVDGLEVKVDDQGRRLAHIETKVDDQGRRLVHIERLLLPPRPRRAG